MSHYMAIIAYYFIVLSFTLHLLDLLLTLLD